MRIRKTGG